MRSRAAVAFLLFCGLMPGQPRRGVVALPGTRPLDLPPDWCERQRRQIVDFYQRCIDAAADRRERAWNSVLLETHRQRLRAMLGLLERPGREARVRVLDGQGARVEEITIAIDGSFEAHALVFWPRSEGRIPALIAIPDGMDMRASWLADLLVRRIAVVVPEAIQRATDYELGRKLRGKDRRHLLHRLAFIAGRTLTGMEVDQALALRAWLAARPEIDAARISLLGSGEGARTALFAAAVEPRFASAAVVPGPQRPAWEEPVDRMLWGQLKEFGEKELGELAGARLLRAVSLEDGARALAASREAAPGAGVSWRPSAGFVERARNRHFESWLDYLRRLDEAADAARVARWALEKTPRANRTAKAAALRRELARLEGVPAGRRASLDPRTRLIRVTDKFEAYDVMLGVFDGVEAYGQLLVPREPGKRLPAVICQHGLGGQPGDVTGLAEKPDVVYHAFAGRLAERGYVVFAPYVAVPIPQAALINPLVRRAAALGSMRTGIEVAKLRRIVDFLAARPFVDPGRIGYYGLSYGGYSAIWMCPLEPRIRAVVISGHFNDWRAKITNEELTTSYLFHPDEDFYSWNVLNRFTHVELIAAMYPRPVMVEYADRDGTTTPEWHERAWGQVNKVAAAWGMADRVNRDVFHGAHEIGGVGTFEFLDRWLRPERASHREYTYLLKPTGRELPGLADNSDDSSPFIFHRLDSSNATSLRGTFRVGSLGPVFSGIAMKVSRAGDPGDLIVRFGTKEGAADLGETRIPPDKVHPLYDLWHDARVPKRRLDPARLYHVELRAERGRAPLDCYVAYGPRRLGGTSVDHAFPFAYRLLGAPRSRGEDTHEFVRAYLDPPDGGPAVPRAKPAQAGEIAITPGWALDLSAPRDEVLRTARDALRKFFDKAMGVRLAADPAAGRIRLEVASGGVEGVHTAEGFRVTAAPREVRIQALTARGALRGAWWLEDALRLRQGPYLARHAVVKNERFGIRITTSILPGGERYTETSRPMIYTDGLLERISRDGFNAVWVWLNTEEAAMDSVVFPELDDPEAPVRFARLEDVARRARRFGIDVYVYLATGYNHHVPDWFYRKYPEVRGVGWGNPMCTSGERVRRYHHEIVRNLFRRAPDLRGLIVIYDSEGFYYCGNSERNRMKCPRCRNRSSEALAFELLTNLNSAMHEVGGTEKRLIAWNYGTDYRWIQRLIPRLPKDILFQVDFSKGGLVVRDGICHFTGDYNLTLVGPPDHFVEQYKDARAAGLPFIAKTEHAVSQEFIFVPYIPAMEQWYRRIAKIREFDVQGWFGNWDHYGYLASLPARLINGMSFDPVPGKAGLLRELAAAEYGEPAAGHVVRAWNEFSEGLRLFPYSDRVSRLPGPLQKGPTQPFLLDPNVKSFGSWRSWQNDLGWTQPWGPVVAAKYLGLVEQHFSKGIAELDAARPGAAAPYRAALDGEWRIARTIESSLRTMLHFIDWIEARDRWYQAQSPAGRNAAAARLEAVAIAERRNVWSILPLLEADSRLGYASEGGGVQRGGLFSPELARWKIGQLDDVLLRQLPLLTGRAPVRASGTALKPANGRGSCAGWDPTSARRRGGTRRDNRASPRGSGSSRCTG